MFKWLFHILIFATSSGKYQNKEKPLKCKRKLGLAVFMLPHAKGLGDILFLVSRALALEA